MKTTKWVYLIRTERRVELTFKRPEEVKLFPARGVWTCRGLEPFCIGREDHGRLLYADNWIGPIGVFDPTNSEHLVELVTQVRKHSMSFAVDMMADLLESISDQNDGDTCAEEPKDVLNFSHVLNARCRVHHQLR